MPLIYFHWFHRNKKQKIQPESTWPVIFAYESFSSFNGFVILQLHSCEVFLIGCHNWPAFIMNTLVEHTSFQAYLQLSALDLISNDKQLEKVHLRKLNNFTFFNWVVLLRHKSDISPVSSLSPKHLPIQGITKGRVR